MSNCDEHRVQLSLYLDGELDNGEKKALEAHLRECSACRNRFNREKRFIGHLQRAAPLYAAPKELRKRIESIAAEMPIASSTGAAHESRPGERLQLRGLSSNVVAVLASLVLVAGLWGIVQIFNPAQSATFADIAVDVHQRYALGRLPLELTSDSPDEISGWFEGKVPFSLKLPNYQANSGQEKLYSLKGARLIGFDNDYAAYVAYEMGQYPISLVVTSSANTKPEGGEEITSEGLVFHYETIAGFKVITWAHRGLTYALVSNLDERGQQSCLVCHQGVKDKDFIAGISR
jgi:anti-sigma factor RsiW